MSTCIVCTRQKLQKELRDLGIPESILLDPVEIIKREIEFRQMQLNELQKVDIDGTPTR